VPRWPTQTLLERFWAKVRVAGADECWPWLAGKNADGFGVFWITSRDPVYAHRLALMLARGPLPEKIFACHTCDDRYARDSLLYRACCNEAHLYAGTNRENMHDCFRHGRHPWALGRDPKALRLAL
jgi:hypothetical protein